MTARLLDAAHARAQGSEGVVPTGEAVVPRGEAVAARTASLLARAASSQENRLPWPQPRSRKRPSAGKIPRFNNSRKMQSEDSLPRA